MVRLLLPWTSSCQAYASIPRFAYFYHCSLLCQIGELVGGSQREERLDVLESRLKEVLLLSIYS